MKIVATVWFVTLCALVTSVAEAGIGDAGAAKLTAKYNCQACHTVDKKLVGPAFRDIAKKYAGDVTAVDKLQGKVKNGSTGVWGPIPMPPNNVPSADLASLVQWIVSLK
jgi:cytochrome c